MKRNIIATMLLILAGCSSSAPPKDTELQNSINADKLALFNQIFTKAHILMQEDEQNNKLPSHYYLKVVHNPDNAYILERYKISDGKLLPKGYGDGILLPCFSISDNGGYIEKGYAIKTEPPELVAKQLDDEPADYKIGEYIFKPIFGKVYIYYYRTN